MKRTGLLTCALGLLVASPAMAVVFLNEVFINPPGSSNDDTREFIELMGTPGKNLDGYAVAFCSGTEAKYYLFESIPPTPNPPPEIDEFFSLDGLSLGANGLLVIGIGTSPRYPQLLPDTNFMTWDTLYNGGLDTTGKLQNDGSNTVLLIRNRPGATEADPGNPIGLRWGKDIAHDAELFSPVEDMVCAGDTIVPGLPCRSAADCVGASSTCVAGFVDQFGDGNLDKAEPDGMGGTTLDLKGSSTPFDVTDDLEVVDEVSYENGRGWEYDLDDRTVDADSTDGGLPQRSVHTLDDPPGFNPDVLVRVDYRTKGPGWAPVGGATGEGPGGNNWQDAATEQWVRGEAMEGSSGVGGFPQFFLDNSANADGDAIQPYVTNVPQWLDDSVAPDYDFTSSETYQIMAGRINPLATAFIPGDADRDGDADQDDIDKIAAVFGDADWVFSNSYDAAPEGDEGDPATQTRPWDVDATGGDGIEASDLQWTLNFQGDATGRIVGVAYDDTTPSAVGVALNPNAGTACTVTVAASAASGRLLNDLRFGDTIELTVAGQVTSGANMAAGSENGIMQFVHDLGISNGGVVQVVDVAPLSGFATTRAALQIEEGVAGDLGVSSVNGYATSFTAGLGSAADLYRVTLRVVGAGSAEVTVQPAGLASLSASTPEGVKIGHTDLNGNPASSTYPAAVVVAGGIAGDADGDGKVDLSDFAEFPACMSGPDSAGSAACGMFDFDVDGDVDVEDYARFQLAFEMP